MSYKITLYDNFGITIHKSGIEHIDNKISNSNIRKTVDLLEDVNVLNTAIYGCGYFINDNKNDRNSCLSNIITLDIDNKSNFDYDKLIDNILECDYKFLLYETNNHNYRLLILLNKQVMSDEYKILWEQYCIKLNLANFVNTTMKDISRKWFATKKFILGNY